MSTLTKTTLTAKFPKGKPMTVDEVAAVVGEEFKIMNENPPDSVLELREEMLSNKSARERLTWQKDRVAVVVPSGLYGYTKAVQGACESASCKLAKAALRIAKTSFAKDADVVPFLQAHAKRQSSRSAKVLLAALREIGPKVASEMRGGHPKEAGAPVYGLYGFKARTADIGLDACKEIRIAAGRITADLHGRKAALHEKLTGFWKEHVKQAKCAYAGMLLSCYPDASLKFATRPSLTGTVIPTTRRLVLASTSTIHASGLIQDVSVLPSEFKPFAQQVRARAAASNVPTTAIHYKMNGYKDVHVASMFNEDGRTRDVDGTVLVTALFHATEVGRIRVGFTGVLEPGPMVTVLASGDYLEWE